MRPERSIVRILGGDFRPVGLGFVAGTRELVTCAHVANVVLGRDMTERKDPGKNQFLQVEFPFCGEGAARVIRTAELVVWRPDPASPFEPRDVAGLRLSEDMPEGAVPVTLADTGDSSGQRVQMWGRFKRDVSLARDGHVTGILMGAVEPGRSQVDQERHGIFRVQPGFSGGPVWRSATGQLVGMLQAIGPEELAVDAYVLDVEVLTKAWPKVFAFLGAKPPASEHAEAGGAHGARMNPGNGGNLEADVVPPVPGAGTITRRGLLLAGGALLATGAAVSWGYWPSTPVDRVMPVHGGGWQELFMDEEVKRVFREHDLEVTVDSLSGVQQASLKSEEKLRHYDFMLCPDENITVEVQGNFQQQKFSIEKPIAIFESRMVVMAHRTVRDCLAVNGLVKPGAGLEAGYDIFDVGAYLRVRLAGTTWGELGGPAPYTQKESPVEVVSGDPCQASSGNLYLSLLAYVHNGGKPILDTSQVDKVANELTPLFGSTWPTSTRALVDDFFSPNHQYPMIFVYEHEALGRLQYVKTQFGVDPANYRLLYADPEVISKHRFVNRVDRKDRGPSRVAELLSEPPLRQLMTRKFLLRVVGEEKLFESTVRRQRLAECVRQGGRSLSAPPNPSAIARFPHLDLMIRLRTAAAQCEQGGGVG